MFDTPFIPAESVSPDHPKLGSPFSPSSVTALIPLFFGVALILCYPGVKNENKIVSHIAVLLTLLILVALFMPLNGAIGRGDSQARNRIILMLLSSGISMVYFIKSFIAARKKKS